MSYADFIAETAKIVGRTSGEKKKILGKRMAHVVAKQSGSPLYAKRAKLRAALKKIDAQIAAQFGAKGDMAANKAVRK